MLPQDTLHEQTRNKKQNLYIYYNIVLEASSNFVSM